MVAVEYQVERVVYLLWAMGLSSLFFVELARIVAGHKVTRLGRRFSIFGATACVVALARSLDPSGVLNDIYTQRQLTVFSNAMGAVIICTVSYFLQHLVKDSYKVAVLGPRKKGTFRSKGILKIQMGMWFYCFVTVGVATLCSIGVLLYGHEFYEGIWFLSQAFVYGSFGIIYSRSLVWLRGRLVKFFGKKYPMLTRFQVEDKAEPHMTHLWFIQYAVIIVGLATVIVQVVLGISAISDTDSKIASPDPQEWEIKDHFSMWIELCVLSIMIWLGWVRRENGRITHSDEDDEEEVRPPSPKEEIIVYRNDSKDAKLHRRVKELERRLSQAHIPEDVAEETAQDGQEPEDDEAKEDEVSSETASAPPELVRGESAELDLPPANGRHGEHSARQEAVRSEEEEDDEDDQTARDTVYVINSGLSVGHIELGMVDKEAEAADPDKYFVDEEEVKRKKRHKKRRKSRSRRRSRSGSGSGSGSPRRSNSSRRNSSASNPPQAVPKLDLANVEHED